MTGHTFCCEAFAKAVHNYRAPVGGGWMYPAARNPAGQIEQNGEGAWNVNGCCGGGCFVVEGMTFCPFCGMSLPGNEAGK